MWLKEPDESMQSAERKSIDPAQGQFLAVPDEINVGGLSTVLQITLPPDNYVHALWQRSVRAI
jgi:hypothetical protein